MKTKLVKFLFEFGDWWKEQEKPDTNDFIKMKIDEGKLNELPEFTNMLVQLSDLLGYKHDTGIVIPENKKDDKS
tara:strand:- start:230 stop:451 length:222 start_codon:yes stop_codon:yes gene_type:complete